MSFQALIQQPPPVHTSQFRISHRRVYPLYVDILKLWLVQKRSYELIFTVMCIVLQEDKESLTSSLNPLWAVVFCTIQKLTESVPGVGNLPFHDTTSNLSRLSRFIVSAREAMSIGTEPLADDATAMSVGKDLREMLDDGKGIVEMMQQGFPLLVFR